MANVISLVCMLTLHTRKDTCAAKLRTRKRFVNEARTHVPFTCINYYCIRRSCRPESSPCSQLGFVNISRAFQIREIYLMTRKLFARQTIRGTHRPNGRRAGGRGDPIDPGDEKGKLKDSMRPHLGYLHYVNARVLHYVSAPRTGR